MIKYEDIVREITVLSNKKNRNEERIKELNDQNNSINSNLKILNSKKETFEKLNSDLESVMRKKKKNVKKFHNEDFSSNYEEENDREDVASNVYWPRGANKQGR